jgi:hypothetical protein
VIRVHTECAQFLGNYSEFLSLGLGTPIRSLSGLRFSLSSPLGEAPGLSFGLGTPIRGLSSLSFGFAFSEPEVAMSIIETQIEAIRQQQAVEMPTP